jgi:hypothetical protein
MVFGETTPVVSGHPAVLSAAGSSRHHTAEMNRDTPDSVSAPRNPRPSHLSNECSSRVLERR